MNIATPYARMLPIAGGSMDTQFTTEDGIALLRRIEWAARISHRSEDAVTETVTSDWFAPWSCSMATGRWSSTHR
jgi:hypothetical protein